MSDNPTGHLGPDEMDWAPSNSYSLPSQCYGVNAEATPVEMAVQLEHLPNMEEATPLEKVRVEVMVKMINGFMPDAVLVCQGHAFRVHKAVLSAQSKFFNAAFNGPFREARESVVHLPKDVPRDVAQMIEFLYLGSFRLRQAELVETHEPGFTSPDVFSLKKRRATVVTYVRIFALADRFMIPSLEAFIMEHLEMLKVEVRFFTFSPDFPTFARLVAESYPIPRLLDYVAAMIADNEVCLLEGHKHSRGIREALEGNSELHMAVTDALARRMTSGKGR